MRNQYNGGRNDLLWRISGAWRAHFQLAGCFNDGDPWRPDNAVYLEERRRISSAVFHDPACGRKAHFERHPGGRGPGDQDPAVRAFSAELSTQDLVLWDATDNVRS